MLTYLTVMSTALHLEALSGIQSITASIIQLSAIRPASYVINAADTHTQSALAT